MTYRNIDSRPGTAADELTADTFRSFVKAVRAEDVWRSRETVCLLCSQFAGTESEMVTHWREAHGVDPAELLYGIKPPSEEQ